MLVDRLRADAAPRSSLQGGIPLGGGVATVLMAACMADEYQPCIGSRGRFCVALNQDAVAPIEGDFTSVTPPRCLGHCSWRNRLARRQGRRPMYQAPVGKVSTTRVPQPATLSRSMRPACRSTMRRASDRPSPTPFGLVV